MENMYLRLHSIGKNYSVSREFTEIFRKGIIVDYEVIIEKNEVSIKKIKDNE